MSDLYELTAGYSSVKMEQLGLLKKFAQGLGRDYDNGIFIRSIYAAAHLVDKLLLAIVPPLRRQCLEVVGVATK